MTSDRYVTVLVADDAGAPLPFPLMWCEWSQASGRRVEGDVWGPVPLTGVDTGPMLMLAAEWALESKGYRLCGPWNEIPNGHVAWVEVATDTARQRA